MYIQPQSIFKLIRGVPMHSDRKHTLYFTSSASQLAYFNSKVKYTYTDFSYVKKDNVVRVPICADNIYDCNYCMFQNVGFGTKWFFGFITNVKYINNEVSEVEIMVDHFQTWLFDMTVENSFVEREHVADDTVGKHTLDEGLNFGGNIIQAWWTYYFTEETNGWKVHVTVKPSLIQQVAQLDTALLFLENQFVPNGYTVDMSASGLETLNQLLSQLLLEGYDIIDMSIYPSIFDNAVTRIPIDDLHTHGVNRPTSYFEMPSASTVEYVPRNKKLLCYPYTYLKVVTTNGDEQNFKWENTNSGEVQFHLYFNKYNGASCQLRPDNYEVSNARAYALAITDFPTVSWHSDKAMSELPLKAIKGAIKSVVGALSGQPLVTTTSVASGVSDVLDVGSQTGFTKVGHGNSNLDLKYDSFGYQFYTMGIKAEYARKVDDYFTRFGYRVDRYKVPELTSRASFNYVKTRECDIGGNIPDEAMNYISDMFNSGVTLWHNPTTVGNYTQDNSIVG